MANVLIGIIVLALLFFAIRRIMKHGGCECGKGECGCSCHCSEHQKK